MNKKTRKLLTFVVVFTMIMTQMFANIAFAATKHEGNDRYATAAQIATSGWTTSDYAVLATGEGYADALAAAPLANAYGAPILITEPGSLNSNTKTALTTLKVKNVIIVGGTGAVSAAVADEVKAMSINVTRIEGANRIETALNTAKEVDKKVGTASTALFLAYADNYADALAASPIAAAMKAPILLTATDALDSAVASYIGSKQVYVLGGAGVISDAAISKLTSPVRLGGADRYATSLTINQKFTDLKKVKFDKVFVATGENFPDALAGSVLAAKTNSILVLVDQALDSNTANFLKTNASNAKVETLGGLATVASAAASIEGYKPATLSVESVSAINASQVDVVFNTAVDKDSAENVVNYKVGTTTLIANTDYAKLQSDGRTVRLTLATVIPVNNTKANITVSKNIKDANSALLGTDYVAKDVLFSDSTIPTLSNVEVTGPKSIKLIFSEPVNYTGVTAYSDFVVDNGSVAVTAANDTNYVYDRAVELTLGTELTAGNHTVKVKANVQDFVPYTMLSNAEMTFTYVADTTAPVASIKSASETIVTVQFNEPVVNANNANVAYRHTYNTSTYEVLGSGTTVSTDGKLVTIDFTGKPIAPGNNTLYISYKSSSGTKIEDKFGNDMSEIALPFSITKDDTKPTASVEAIDATTLEVTYSEEVTGATVKSNYSLKDSGNSDLTISNIALKAGTTKTYVITLSSSTPMKGGSYTIGIKNMKDKSVAANTMDDYTKTFSVTDDYSPSLSSVVAAADVSRGGKYNVVATFSESMNADDLATLSNYRLYDVSAAAEVSLTSTNCALTVIDDKTVKLATEITDVVVSTDKLVVSGSMKDLAGNTVGGFSTNMVLSPDTVGLRDLDSVTAGTQNIKLTAEGKIYVEVNKILDSVNVNAIKVSLANVYGNSQVGIYNVGLVSLTKDTANGKTKIEFSLPSGKTFATDGSAFADGDIDGSGNATGDSAISFGAGAFTSILGASNLAIDITKAGLATALIDKVAPKILSASTAAPAGGADGTVGQISVVFSEDLLDSSVAYDKFTVDGYTVKAASEAAGTVTLTVAEDNATGTATAPTVKLVGDVADTSLNVLTHTDDTKVDADDATAPYITSFKVKTGEGAAASEITLVLSEKVYTNAAATTALTSADDTVFEVDPDGIGAAIYENLVIDSVSEDGLTITGHIASGDVAADATATVRAKATTLYGAEQSAMPTAAITDGADN